MRNLWIPYRILSSYQELSYTFLFLFISSTLLHNCSDKGFYGNVTNLGLLDEFGKYTEWNLDLTKSLGTGQICSLNGGFVI